MASGASSTYARNWGLYTNYSDWGNLDFRVSSAKLGVAHTTRAMMLSGSGAVIFDKHIAVGAETAIADWEDTSNEWGVLHLGNGASVLGAGSATTNSQLFGMPIAQCNIISQFQTDFTTFPV